MAEKAVVLPKNYEPTDKEEYMSPKQLEYFRQKLLHWKDDLKQESQLTIEHLQRENWSEPDPNDKASLEVETAFELRTRNRYLKLMNKIDSALARIEDGSYGFCEETGEPIGLGRLKARPIATLSIEAQERHERFEKNHSEE